jgi:hypothetical protein
MAREGRVKAATQPPAGAGGIRWAGHLGLAQAFRICQKKDFRAGDSTPTASLDTSCYDASLTAKFAIKNIKTEADLEKIFSVLTWLAAPL